MPRAAFPGGPVAIPPYPGALSRPSLRGARDSTAGLLASEICGERCAPPRAPRRDRAAFRPLRRDSRKRRPLSGYSAPAPPPPQRGQSKARPPPRRPAMAAIISRPPAPPGSRLERGDILSRCGGVAPRYAPYTPRLSNSPSVAVVADAPHTRPRQHTPIPSRYVSARPGCPPRGARCIPSSPTAIHSVRAARGSKQGR